MIRICYGSEEPGVSIVSINVSCVKYLGDKVPTISFTEKFIDSVSLSSRDVSSKSWESIGDFTDYESVKDKVQRCSDRFCCLSRERRYRRWLHTAIMLFMCCSGERVAVKAQYIKSRVPTGFSPTELT